MKRFWSGLGNFGKGLIIGLVFAGVYLGVVLVSPDAEVLWIVSLAPVLLIAFFVGFRVPDDVVKRWSRSHGLPITDENRDVLIRHLNRGRRIRTTGAVLGFVGYMVFTVEVAQDNASWGILRSTFLGYLIGAALAEFWALRLRPQGPRTASLEPRRVRDYVPFSALYILRAGTGATVVLAIAWHWIHLSSHIGSHDARPSVVWAAMWAGIALAVAIFVEIVARHIVRRPQPAVSDELLRVDDAIRSASIHQLVGAGLALVLGIVTGRLGDLTPNTSPQGLRNFFGIMSLFTGIGSIAAWLDLGIDQKWIVRRSQPRREVAA